MNERPPQSVETSSKYASWSLKEISENIAKLVKLFEERFGSDSKQPKLPF